MSDKPDEKSEETRDEKTSRKIHGRPGWGNSISDEAPLSVDKPKFHLGW